MTRLRAALERTDQRIPGIDLPLLSVSQTRGVIRRSELTDKPPRAETLDVYKVCRAGDLVFNKMSIRAGAVGVAREDGLVTYHYEVMRARAGHDPWFLAYLMKSEAFISELVRMERGIGAGEQANVRTTEVPFSVLRLIEVLLPSLSVQRLVVAFLDRETAKIDTLIAKQEALTRSVLEHRDAVILDLITGGKGAAKSEASGVDWIGDMPEHWQTRPLRHVLASVETGVWGSDPAVEWEGTPCARVADFDRERLQVTDPIPTLREVSVEDVRRRGLRRGDLLIERSGGTQANPVGFVVSFESDTEAVCSNFISRVRLQDGMNHRYWLYAFYAARLTRITEKWTKQTTGIQNLDFGGFSSEHFPCPPSSEQDEIAAEIDQLMSSTGAQLQRQRLLGQLLRERRAALITAAVTGRLDVTTYGKAG